MHIRIIPYLAIGALFLAPSLVRAQEPAAEEVPPPAEEAKAPPAEGEAPPPAEGDAAAAAPAAGDAPAEEELSEDGGALEFAQAMEQLLLENYIAAARLAYVAMKKTKPSAEKYESAQFVLAESLAGAGLSSAAAEYYFAVADQRQNPALLPRALSGLERLTRQGLVDEDKLLRGVLVEANLSNVPLEVETFLSFYRGLSNLRLGYRRWAAADFSILGKEGFYAQLAQYVRVVTLVRDEKSEKALEVVDALLEDDKNEERVLDEVIKKRLLLVRARLLYEGGKLKESIEEYSKLRGTVDAQEGEILVERAWAHFRNGDYHDAMGLLYALAAPSSRELFLPDQYVLRGLIYQRFCHFRAAKAAVRDFRDRYGDAVMALKRGESPDEVPVVAAAAKILPEVEPSLRVLTAVQNEKLRLEDIASSIEEGGLLAHMNSLYGTLTGRAERLHRRAMMEGSRLAAERLLESDEQANLLEYEVGVSIFKPIASASGEVKLRQAAEEVPSGGPTVYYPFDGEFWTDELPHMRFLIQDRCVE